MHRAPALFAGLLALVAGATGADAADSDVIYTRKNTFRIPYRYDAAEIQKLGAREIRLFVSNDRGLNWQHVRTVSPETGRFDFQASADGEYWFSVRTMDGAGNLHPAESEAVPGLKVVVDTIIPELQIRLHEVEPGKVQMNWNAVDVNLDATQLKLEYRHGDGEWQPVSVAASENGQTAWTVGRAGAVAVRGVVMDRASNAGRAEAFLNIGQSARNAPPAPPIPDASGPVAGGRQIIQPKSDQLISDNGSSRPAILGGRYPIETDDAGASKPSNGARVVNTRRFQIGYQVDEVGPSGVSSVEFYITQDNGKKWWKYGDDPDRTSPFAVEVPADGAYGFELRVRSGAGLASDPPQPGEKPSIVIVVDQTPPTAQLMQPEQGSADSMNQLKLRWSVSDDHPADEPVALSYATSPEGPWEPITTWQADTRSHVWTIAPGLPGRLYIRLTARDAAGNVTQVQTPQPVLVDFTRPRARIVDVETMQPGATAK